MQACPGSQLTVRTPALPISSTLPCCNLHPCTAGGTTCAWGQRVAAGEGWQQGAGRNSCMHSAAVDCTCMQQRPAPKMLPNQPRHHLCSVLLQSVCTQRGHGDDQSPGAMCREVAAPPSCLLRLPSRFIGKSMPARQGAARRGPGSVQCRITATLGVQIRKTCLDPPKIVESKCNYVRKYFTQCGRFTMRSSQYDCDYGDRKSRNCPGK